MPQAPKSAEERRREARKRLQAQRAREMGQRKARAQQATRSIPKEMVEVRRIARPTGVGSRGGSKTVPVMASRRARLGGKIGMRPPVSKRPSIQRPARSRRIPKQSGR